MMILHIHHLRLSWSISWGRETAGYNICRLDDSISHKRYKCMGGGYDMIGTVFGDFIEDQYQNRLMELVKERMKDPQGFEDCGYFIQGYIKFPGLLGMIYNTKKGEVKLDGGCGIDSMITIAKEIGLSVQWEGNRKGHTVGYFVYHEVTE